MMLNQKLTQDELYIENNEPWDPQILLPEISGLQKFSLARQG